MKNRQSHYRIHLEYDLSRKDERWNRKESIQLNNELYYLEGIEEKLPQLRNVEQGWEINYDEREKTSTSAHLDILAQNKQQAAQIVSESRNTIEQLLLPPHVRMPEEILATEVKQ